MRLPTREEAVWAATLTLFFPLWASIWFVVNVSGFAHSSLLDRDGRLIPLTEYAAASEDSPAALFLASVQWLAAGVALGCIVQLVVKIL